MLIGLSTGVTCGYGYPTSGICCKKVILYPNGYEESRYPQPVGTTTTPPVIIYRFHLGTCRLSTHVPTERSIMQRNTIIRLVCIERDTGFKYKRFGSKEAEQNQILEFRGRSN